MELILSSFIHACVHSFIYTRLVARLRKCVRMMIVLVCIGSFDEYIYISHTLPGFCSEKKNKKCYLFDATEYGHNKLLPDTKTIHTSTRRAPLNARRPFGMPSWLFFSLVYSINVTLSHQQCVHLREIKKYIYENVLYALV